MPLPSMSDRNASDAILIKFGPITVWFADGGGYFLPVAFRVGDDERIVFSEIDVEQDSPDRERLTAARNTIPYSRFSTPLNVGDFEDAWDKATDGYLFPKRVGKLRQDWIGFDKDVPLGVLADYLADHGMEEAAKVLRESKQTTAEAR